MPFALICLSRSAKARDSISYFRLELALSLLKLHLLVLVLCLCCCLLLLCPLLSWPLLSSSPHSFLDLSHKSQSLLSIDT
jgi:hypothetical protein